MNDYQDLDVRLTDIFGQAAIATAAADKRLMITKLKAFAGRAERNQRPELAAEALRLQYDLEAELFQAGEGG